MKRKRRITGGKMLIEENGTGRQWTSTAACAISLKTATATVTRAIREGLPIKGRYYFKTDPKESICWNCQNTAENVCDLFTSSIRYPPKGSRFVIYHLLKNHCKDHPDTYEAYCVHECPNYNPEVKKHIVR